MMFDMIRYIKKYLDKIRGKKDGELERSIDWSELPPELLDLISQKLGDIFDFVRFRAVCTKWRSSTQLLKRAFLPLAWMLPVPNITETHYISFFTCSSSKLRLTFPKSFLTYTQDYNGFFPFHEPTDKSSLFIFNPLTKTKIPLPSLSSLDIEYIFNKIQPVQLCPDRSDQCVLLLQLKNDIANSALLSCRVGDELWTLAIVPYFCNNWECNDVLYMDKYLVSLQRTSVGLTTRIFNVATGSELFSVELSQINTWNRLVKCAGELLLVAEHFNDKITNRDIRFEIYKLDVEKLQWTKKTNIDNHILFVDSCLGGFSVNIRNFSGYKGNCIFLIKNNHENSKHSCTVYRHDLQNGKTDVAWCPSNWCLWYMPNSLAQ